MPTVSRVAVLALGGRAVMSRSSCQGAATRLRRVLVTGIASVMGIVPVRWRRRRHFDAPSREDRHEDLDDPRQDTS